MSTGKHLSYYCFDGEQSRSQHLRVQVFTEVLMKSQVFWDIMSFPVINGHQNYGGVWCLKLHDPSSPRRMQCTRKIYYMWKGNVSSKPRWVTVMVLCNEWTMHGMHGKVKGSWQKMGVQYGKESREFRNVVNR
jgi:hypothetical protein